MAKVKVSSYILYQDNLPKSFDGFKIAHISDLHSKPAEGIYDAIADHSPDIIAITGDLVHDDGEDYQRVVDLVRSLADIAPVYAVTGNHDLWRTNHKNLIATLTDAGAKFLRSEMVKIKRGDDEISI